MVKPTAYIPGLLPTHPGPLARFLPLAPHGVVTAWLKSLLPDGGLVLDPFGAQPRLTIEAARAGYQVIVTANNPVTRFLLEISANPPGGDEMGAILADFAATRRGQERLEPHIRGLYLTQCENCGREVEAQAFIWERETRSPVSKVYNCQYCGEKDYHPTDEQDLTRAAQFDADRLHRSRALERVASPDDPDRHYVEEALETYLPRAVYALFTLINRLDSLSLPPIQRRSLELMLLDIADYGNSLWTYPPGRARPRTLALSPKFFENNIWMALENSILEYKQDWETKFLSPIPVTIWPDQPAPQGGISIYEGRLKDLIQPLKTLDIRAVMNIIPRPNQAFWTLSALWAGWLWGKEAVRPFKGVLRRRRYDWNWHSAALHAMFENLNSILGDDQPILGLITEAEPGFLSASLIAAELAGFSLSEYALRAESAQAQLTWQKRSPQTAIKRFSRQEMWAVAARSTLQHIQERAEPAGFLQTSCAGLIALAEETHFNLELTTDMDQPLKPMEIQAEVAGIYENAFTYRNGFLRLGGSEKSLEVGQWWVRDTEKVRTSTIKPLADRIEIEVLRYLQQNPASGQIDIDRAICAAFPGLLTPSSELVHMCISSYAEQKPDGSDQWYLRPEDNLQKRRENIASIQAALMKIAERLGFLTQASQPLVWQDENGEAALVFYIITTAIIGDIVHSNPYPAGKSILVIPASRANIALFKQKRNTLLSQEITRGWRFLKYRHVYRLLDNPLLSRENFDHQFTVDPLQDISTQMRLL